MANNVSKYISVKGPIDDICFIYRHIVNLMDCNISHTEYEERCQLGAFLDIAGGSSDLIDSHGWSEIWEVSFDRDIMWIHVLTPYGNIHDFMEYLKERFPKCEFHCFNDNNEENDED